MIHLIHESITTSISNILNFLDHVSWRAPYRLTKLDHYEPEKFSKIILRLIAAGSITSESVKMPD